MTLKTLKDLEYEETDSEIGPLGYNIVDVKELRQEAIKWYKRMSKYSERKNYADARKGRGLDIFITYEPDYDIPEETLIWIKHFFNITEEELK